MPKYYYFGCQIILVIKKLFTIWHLSDKLCPEAYSEPSKTAKIELFANIVNSWKPSTICAKSSILDVGLKSEYASGILCATLNPLTTNVPHHIETSQFICNANQLTGFYMMGNIDR